MSELLKHSNSHYSMDRLCYFIQVYYLFHGTGGYFHIFLDDGNLKDHHIQSCIEHAEASNDLIGVGIGRILLQLSLENRELLYKSDWNYDKFWREMKGMT